VKILVADDNDMVREYLCEVLRDAGYETLQAGNQALALCRTQPVGLIVTDLCMPDKDGIETIRCLVKEGWPIKIVALSGAMGGLYLSVVKLGADFVMEKPINPNGLLKVVERLLSAPALAADHLRPA